MKTQLLPALKLNLVTIVFFAILYPALIWGVAQFAVPKKGRGGLANVGQSITKTATSVLAHRLLGTMLQVQEEVTKVLPIPIIWQKCK